MLLIILLQRKYYGYETGLYWKMKQKNIFHHNIPCHFQEIWKKLFIYWYQLIFMKVIHRIVFTNTVMYCITTQEQGWYVMMKIFCNWVYIHTTYIMNYHMRIYIRRRKNIMKVSDNIVSMIYKNKYSYIQML